MGLTLLLNDPYSGNPGGVVTNASGNQIVLDGVEYLVDNLSGDYRRVDLPVIQQRNTADARDQLLLPQGVWRTQVHSWHEGAGQSFYDRSDSLSSRFDDSYGMDCWTRYNLTMLNSTKRLSAGSSGDVFLQTHGAYVVAGEGTALKWWTALSEDATPTSLTVGTVAMTSMAYDGDAIITLHSDGKVYKSTSPTVTSLFGTFASASFVAFVKDYLITGVNNVLTNITSGSPTTIYTAPVSGFRWIGAAEGDRAIYALGGVGDRWVVHKVGIKDDASGLLPAVVAAQLPDGEIGYSIGSYLGYIFIGTSKGVRMAQATDTGDLTLGALIPTDQPVRCFEGQDRFVWYGNSAIDATYSGGGTESSEFPSTTVCGLGRMDLTTFTVTALTPAYANDIVADTVTDKQVMAAVTFGDKRVFAVKDGGVWYETDDKMPAGWLTIGSVSFSVDDIKTGLNQQANWLPLTGSIIFGASYDSSGFITGTTYGVQGTVRSGSDSLNGVQFSRMVPRITMLRSADDATEGPTMTRWEVRVSPVQGGSSRWTVPIINSSQINVSGRKRPQDVLATKNRLMDIYRTGRLVTYIEDGTSYLVQVKGFDWRPEKLNDQRTAWQGVFVVTLEEVA